jgi:hypothetical protein
LARTDSWGDQSFETDEVGGTLAVSLLGFRATGKRVFGCVKRELIAVGGKQAAASKAWRSPKRAVIRSEWPRQARRWITVGEHRRR